MTARPIWLLALALVACAPTQRARRSGDLAVGEPVQLMTFGREDPEGLRALRLLERARIRAGLPCSLTCELWVVRRDVARARLLLAADPALGRELQLHEEGERRVERLRREADATPR